jgi:hypothetical protein
MPRIRTIKPEFATDEKLARVSRDARLTFVLCITQADDDGLLPGNHRQLLAALYPLDDAVSYAKLAGWLEELVEMGRLRWRQTVDGSPILEITRWAAHQRVDHKGKSLILPHLKPWTEDDAKVSGESREDVASVSRPDLGPRTMDHGPTGVETVVAHYLALHPKRRPGEKDRKLIARHLGTYSPNELCEALDGNATDEWAKDKGKHELTWVLRDNGQIDTYRAKAEKAAPAMKIVDGWFADAMQ